MQPTRHSKIAIWKNVPMDRDKLRTGVNELITIAKRQNYGEIVRKIRKLVPEYSGGNKVPQTQNNAFVNPNENVEIIEEET
jgi:hypothetical protein